MEQFSIIIFGVFFLVGIFYIAFKIRDFKETREAKRQARIEEKKRKFLDNNKSK